MNKQAVDVFIDIDTSTTITPCGVNIGIVAGVIIMGIFILAGGFMWFRMNQDAFDCVGFRWLSRIGGRPQIATTARKQGDRAGVHRADADSKEHENSVPNDIEVAPSHQI